MTAVWVLSHGHGEAWLCVWWRGRWCICGFWCSRRWSTFQSGRRSKLLEPGSHLENCMLYSHNGLVFFPYL